MVETSFFQGLAAALGWTKRSEIAVLVGYFDESGPTLKPRLLTIAGAICPMDRWATFEVEWRAMLADEGLDQIHITDMARARKGTPYANKKLWPVERRDALFKRCVTVGRECIPTPFFLGATIPLSGPPKHIRSEYFRCFQRVTEALIRKIQQNLYQDTDPVALIFAHHPAVPEARLARYMKIWQAAHPRCGSFTVGKPQYLPQLQVADMLAFVMGELFRLGPAAPALYRNLVPNMNFEVPISDAPGPF